LIGPAEYQDIAATSMFHSWNQAFRFTGFLERSPNTNLAWYWEQHEGLLIWPYYIFPIIRCPGFMMISPSFSSCSVVFSNQRFNNCSSTMDIGFVKLLSGCFCGNRISSSAVAFAAVVLICVCHHNLENSALDTLNKVAILVTHAPAKHTPTICPL